MGHHHPGSFGALLRRHRLTAGLSQEALAERAGMSARGLKYLECGARWPYPDTLRRLAAALALTTEERDRFMEATAGMTRTAPPRLAVDRDVLPLIGRAPERALLERHLRGEGPPVLLLAGEPGIGKSRLLEYVARQAPIQGWSVLAGGCSRRAGQDAFAPFVDALQRHIRDRAPDRALVDLRGCAWLIRLLPDLPDLAGAPMAELPAGALLAAQERRLMFEAVGRYLSNVAGPAGALLVLDDLQWAGPDALDLLSTVVRSAAPAALRVVGAYRPTEAPAQGPLAAALADFAGAGQATRHPLGPLTPTEAGHLLDHLLADNDTTTATRERVLQRADGVPFFLVSCARGLRARDADAGEGDVPEDVPWDVTQSVRQRIVALPATAQDVLSAAAVVGRVVERAALVDMVAQPAAAVLEALDAACQARLLEEEGRTAYRFAHDVIREVIEGALGAARRASLHQYAAEALERASGAPSVEALAYHYAHSDVLDKAATYLARAGDRARGQHAHTAAESYYRAAIERFDQIGRAHEAATAREALGGVLFTLNRNDAAIATLERAATAYRVADNAAGIGRISALIGWTHYRQGRAAEGLRRVEDALAIPGMGAEAVTAAALQVARATCLGELGRFTESVAAAERGVEYAAIGGDVAVEARAHSVRGGTLRLLGRFDEAVWAGERARALAEAAGDLRTLCYELNGWAFRLLLGGNVTGSRSVHARLVAVGERFGSPQFIVRPLTLHAFIATYDGQWREARADLARALPLARPLDQPEIYANLCCLAGQLCLVEGRLAPASRWLRRALAGIGDALAPEVRPWAQRLLAEVDLHEGRPRAAQARLEPILAGADQHDTAFMLPSLAWAHLQQGRLSEAERVAVAAVARARAERNRLALVDALRVRALVAMELERWDEARCALDDGLDLARRSGYLPAETRLMGVYGELHARMGTLEAAQKRHGETDDSPTHGPVQSQ